MASARDQRLQRLDEYLLRLDHADEVMLLPTLDGFLAGVAVCPVHVAPSEWLPEVWGGEMPAFADQREAQEVIALITGYHNDILRSLARPGGYAPVIEEALDGSPLWEVWIDGFAKAVAFRLEAWEAIYDVEAGEDDARMALAVLLRLDELAAAPEIDEDDPHQELIAEAPAAIAHCVAKLHAARSAREGVAAAPAQSARVGRNDPCPCGSGRKFKKCCLQ